jgi:UDP-glucose 4-epimerase
MRILVAGGAPIMARLVTDALESNRNQVFSTLSQSSIDAVLHLGIFDTPRDSVSDPRTSACALAAAIDLIDAAVRSEVKRLVLLSSCAVYGEPAGLPVTEDAPFAPISPFGEASVALEQCVRNYSEAYGLETVVLRAFNISGVTEPARHLLPSIIEVARGRTEFLEVFGEDYATHDGSCVRDYVHVSDVTDALLVALEASGTRSAIYNVGFGAGYSVLEVVEMARQVTRQRIPTEAEARRRGEPAAIISSPDRIMSDLGWQPRHSELDVIIDSVWQQG